MQAIEVEAEIDENHELHLKLPDHAVGPAKVIVLLQDSSAVQKRPPVQLGLFRGKIRIGDDFDEPLPDDFWLSGKP
jgi:hypothetical protein